MSSKTNLEIRVPKSVKEKVRYIARLEGTSMSAIVQESLRTGKGQFLPVRCLADDDAWENLRKDERLYVTLDRTLFGSLQGLATHNKRISTHCRDISLRGSYWFYWD